MEQQTQQPIQEKTEPKPAIKTNWKLIAIVALVTVVFAVGGIFLLRGLSPTPAAPTPPVVQQPPSTPSPQPHVFDTSDWQTYRNEEFGFEVRYPADWRTVGSSPNQQF